MSSAAAAAPGGLVPTRVLFRESWRWLRKNWLRTLIFSVLSFLIAWAWNVWIMARKLEGSVADPGSETTATAQGKTWNGIYWLLCTTILFGLITYGREKGFKNLLREFFTPPFTFFENLFKRPRSAIAMACWGAALALLIGSVVSNAISGLLGLGFLLAAPTALAIVLNNVLIRAWIGAFSAAQPRLKSNATAAREPLRHDARRGDRRDPRVEDGRRRGADRPRAHPHRRVVRGRRDRPRQSACRTPIPLILFVGAGVVTWKVLRATPAHADDGGWLECATASGEPCSELGFFQGWWEWRKSAGADVVIRQARIGGSFSAFGAVIGCALGGGLAALASAFSSSATGGAGPAGLAGSSPPAGPSPLPSGAEHGIESSLGQPASGQPGTALPQPAGPAGTGADPAAMPPPDPFAEPPALPAEPATHSVAEAEGATSSRATHDLGGALSEGSTPPASTTPAGTPGAPPAPTPVARASGAASASGLAPPSAPPVPDAAGAGAGPAGAEHSIAHGLEGATGTDAADIAPTSATRSAPDVTPTADHPASSAEHSIAHGLEGATGTDAADIAPTSATRSAPDVTPGDAADIEPTSATRSAPDVTPGDARTAPDVTPGAEQPDAADIAPTGARRGAPDVTPDQPGQPGAAGDAQPPAGGQPPPRATCSTTCCPTRTSSKRKTTRRNRRWLPSCRLLPARPRGCRCGRGS